MSIHKTFSPDLRQLLVSSSSECMLLNGVLQPAKSTETIEVDIPYRPLDKNNPAHLRAATSNAPVRDQRSIVVKEAPELARHIRERHRQIKSHFREIKKLVEEPMGSWSQSRTLSHFRDQRSIKKTELTANEVFTEKDLERLDQREAAQAKPVTLMGHKRLNDKPEEMRKEIHKFMEWANQPVQIKQYRKPVDSGYRRFHTREQKDNQLRNSDILPYWTKQHRQQAKSSCKQRQSQRQNLYASAQKQLEEQVEQVSRKVLNENRNFFCRSTNKHSNQATQYRIQGLYEARMMKLAHRLLDKQNLPFKLVFGEQEQSPAPDSNPFLNDDSPKQKKFGLERYRQWLRQEKKRLKQTL